MEVRPGEFRCPPKGARFRVSAFRPDEPEGVPTVVGRRSCSLDSGYERTGGNLSENE